VHLARGFDALEAQLDPLMKTISSFQPLRSTVGTKELSQRRAIYTTNAIESLNSAIRSATKRRKLFPNENSAMKVVYLAIMQASKKWTMPIQNWRAAMNRFEIEFGDRLNAHQ